MGMSHSVLASRLNGSTAFLAEDIEDIAKLLKRDAVELYAEYLSVGPAGIEPTTSTVESGQLAPVVDIMSRKAS